MKTNKNSINYVEFSLLKKEDLLVFLDLMGTSEVYGVVNLEVAVERKEYVEHLQRIVWLFKIRYQTIIAKKD
jgi:hypothetical protein